MHVDAQLQIFPYTKASKLSKTQTI